MRKAPSNINNLCPYVERISLSFPRDPAGVQWIVAVSLPSSFSPCCCRGTRRSGTHCTIVEIDEKVYCVIDSPIAENNTY